MNNRIILCGRRSGKTAEMRIQVAELLATGERVYRVSRPDEELPRRKPFVVPVTDFEVTRGFLIFSAPQAPEGSK